MSIRIGIGSGLGQPAPAEDYWRWVQLCEGRGIDSIWHSDQLLGPNLEPMAMMAALAAATTTLRFGFNAVVISHRDPLIIAKECATIDYLAPGRLLPVFGVGDAADPAWAATGRNPKGRGGRANEAIAIIRRLLSEDSVTFEGEHFRYKEARVAPRPGRPIPIWIGGQSKAAIQRTAALGDGWLGGFTSPQVAADVIGRIKVALKQAGRHIDEDHYGVVVPYRVGAPDDPAVTEFNHAMGQRRSDPEGRPPARTTAAGPASAVVDVFQQFVDAGVSKFVAIPIANDWNDLIVQTELLVTEICPKIEDR